MNNMGLPDSLTSFDDLCVAYGEKHRYYHTSEHISAMLRHFDDAAELAHYPYEVELAIWFHDAIYKPFSSRNEVNSAHWAKTFLLEHGYDSAGAHRVYRLIMATYHQGDVVANDEQLIVDIDLTILGSSKPVYEAFERHVRKEYRLVPSFIYRKKRKALLQSFLSRNYIYHLDYFRNKYEQVARENIKNALNNL
jgi:predicted metal-dependent HD superfamily phosphohydrolase